MRTYTNSYLSVPIHMYASCCVCCSCTYILSTVFAIHLYVRTIHVCSQCIHRCTHIVVLHTLVHSWYVTYSSVYIHCICACTSSAHIRTYVCAYLYVLRLSDNHALSCETETNCTCLFHACALAYHSAHSCVEKPY